MKISYDKTIDAKYVRIKFGRVFRTERKNDWLIFDYNKKGEILGIEILDASRNNISIMTDGRNLIEYLIDLQQETEKFNAPFGVTFDHRENSLLTPQVLSA
jgi:uncharacterized protein YuzE